MFAIVIASNLRLDSIVLICSSISLSDGVEAPHNRSVIHDCELCGRWSVMTMTIYKLSCVYFTGISIDFWTGREVKQGCSLSPGLFNLLTADLEEETRKEGWGRVRLKGEKVYSLAYADDVVLLAEGEGDVRAMMARLESYVRGKRLEVNVGKSKIMRFKRDGRRKKIRWRWEGKEVEEVRKYKYLGYVFQSNGGQERQVRERVKRGMAVMGRYGG